MSQSKTVDLFLATTELLATIELLARESCGVQEGLVRVWLREGPRAADSQRRVQQRTLGIQSGQKWENSENEPSAFLNERSSCSPAFCPVFMLVHSPVFLNDKTKHSVSLGGSKSSLSGQTEELEDNASDCEKYLNWSSDNTGISGCASLWSSKAIMP